MWAASWAPVQSGQLGTVFSAPAGHAVANAADSASNVWKNFSGVIGLLLVGDDDVPAVVAILASVGHDVAWREGLVGRRVGDPMA